MLENKDYEIWNGDCLELMKNIPNNSIDCIICDLPYYKIVKNEFDNQWKTLDEYLSFVENIIQEYNRICKDNSNIFVFTSRQLNHKICNILDKYFKEERIIIWARKRAFNNTRGKALSSGYEPIAFYKKGKPYFNNIKIKVESNRREYKEGILKDGICLSDVWTDINALPHNSKEKVAHPTQKPIKLIERILSISTKEGDTVLDNCMGSGTTGVACVNLHRKFIGIEKDEKYFEIAKTRIKEFK